MIPVVCPSCGSTRLQAVPPSWQCRSCDHEWTPKQPKPKKRV
jgi:hypothetical protein